MKRVKNNLISVIVIITLMFFNINDVFAVDTYSTNVNAVDSSQSWSIASGTGLNPSGASSAFTISAWAKSNIYVGAYVLLGGKGEYTNGTTNKGYWFYFIPTSSGDTQLGIYIMNNGTTVPQTAGNTTDAKAWHHYAATYSAANNRVRFYVDGTQYGSDWTVNTDLGASTNSYIIGRQTYFTAGSTRIQDERFYNVELSASSVADIYNNPTTAPISGIQAQWLFNGNGNDSSANANNLTNNNSCTFVLDAAYQIGGTTPIISPKINFE